MRLFYLRDQDGEAHPEDACIFHVATRCIAIATHVEIQ